MWRKPSDANPSSQPLTKPTSSPAVSADKPSPGAHRSQPQPAPASSNVSKLGASFKIEGDLSGSSDLYIDGELHGTIRLESGRLTVGPSGRIQADIQASEVVVEGLVQGNIKASQGVRFGASSRVAGDVLSPRLAIDDGASVRGNVETVRPAQPARPAAAESVPQTESLPALAAGVARE